jgi:class 3 adenylate cyclase
LIIKKYPATTYQIKHSVGVDSGELFVARTGIRKYNDLVWVGAAANLAAKLCNLRDPMKASWITSGVFSSMLDESKYANDGRLMWESHNWKLYNSTIYGSNWTWPI